MAFIGNKTRKNIDVNILSDVDVLSIPIDNMTLVDSSYIIYFKRLGYKNCPSLKRRSRGTIFNLKKNENLIDMNRWDQVENIYEILIKIDRRPRTKRNIFDAIIQLVQHCDKNDIDIILSIEAIKSFVTQLKNSYLDGIKGKTLMQIQSSIKAVLFEFNPVLLNDLKSDFICFPDDTSPVEPYYDYEVKQIVAALYRVFNTYRKSVLANEVPILHPLYDEECLKRNNNYNSFTESSWRKKIQSENNRDTWKNDLIKTAFFLTSFYTGANESTLINLKFSDISNDQFDETSRGNFKLKTVKNRQKGKVNIIDIGFSARAKDFFETWLLLSKILTNYQSDYIFPSLVKGNIKKSTPARVQVTLNNTFKLLGLPLLSTQRFRKTKATLIMRATESIFSVAQGLNNSLATVSKHYSNGDPIKMNFSIARALDVRQRTIIGEPLDKAIKNSSYQFSDPVRAKFFIKNNLDKPSIISNGLRCKDPFGKKAERLKNSLIKAGLAKNNSKVACYKFLECFGCEHHAIVAEADDIWLLLSFRDIILDVSSMPSINTVPTDTLTKIVNTIESILERLKYEYRDNYDIGLKKYNVSPHPLWSDTTDLTTMIELF
ncbi:TPA: site-specific integrase [Photobacterium damselae]